MSQPDDSLHPQRLASDNDMLDELAAQLDERAPQVPVFFIYDKMNGEEFPLVLTDVSFVEDKIIVRLAE